MTESKNVTIVEANNGLEIISGGSRTFFCNAHIDPFEKIVFAEGYELYNCNCKFYIDDEGKKYHKAKMLIGNEDLTSIERFKRMHPSLTTTPYSTFMPALKMYIMRKFARMEEEGTAKSRQGVTSSGAVYNAKTDSIEYCINDYSSGDTVAHQQVPINSDFYTKKLESIDNVSDYVRDIIGLHYEYITVNILCWCAAVMAKPFADRPVKNPALFSYGINNSGKSSLHKNIIGRLFDMKSSVMTHKNAEPEQMFCSGQTSATLQRISSASNLIPMLLDEFKYFRDQRLRDMMSNFIRNSYDQTTVSKAIDYSANMQHYNIIRPVAMTGESNFGDEQAIINRQIIVQHRRFKPEHQERFRRFKFSKMKNLGYMMFDMLFKKQDWEWLFYDNERYQQYHIDSRNYENMDFLYNGMHVINQLCQEEVITKEMFDSAMDHYVAFILSEDVTDVEDMLQILESYVKSKKRSIVDSVTYADVKDGKLYITFYPVYEELKQAGLRNKNSDVIEKLNKVGLLRHRNVSYSKMNTMRGHIYEISSIDFFSKINVDRYPNLFGNIGIEENNLDSIQTLIYD